MKILHITTSWIFMFMYNRRWALSHSNEFITRSEQKDFRNDENFKRYVLRAVIEDIVVSLVQKVYKICKEYILPTQFGFWGATRTRATLFTMHVHTKDVIL